jgi:lysophospholipase L1-like esterase
MNLVVAKINEIIDAGSTGGTTPTGTKATAPTFGTIDDVNDRVPVSSPYPYTETVVGMEGKAGSQLASDSFFRPGNVAGRAFAYVVANGSRLQSDTVYSAPFTMGAAAVVGKAQQIVDGDSLDAGQGSSNPPSTAWPNRMYQQQDATKFGSPIVAAVPGQSTQAMLDRQQQYVLNQIDTANYAMCIIYVGGGINDLMQGLPVATLIAQKKQYIANIAAWSAAHNNFPIRVVLLGLTPNGKLYGAISLAECEIRRDAVNDDMRGNFDTSYCAYNYVNYNSNNALNFPDDTTYFDSDYQHFNNTGYVQKAAVVLPVAIATQAGSRLTPPADAAPPVPVNGVPDPNYTGSNLREWSLSYGVIKDSAGVVTAWTDRAKGDVLIPAPAGCAVYHPTGGPNNKPYISIAANGRLLGSTKLGITGNQPSSYAASIRPLTTGNMNLFGHGSPGGGSSAACFRDVLIYGGALSLHINLPGNLAAGPSAPTTWGFVGARLQPNSAGTGAVGFTQVGGTESAAFAMATAAATDDAVLTIGAGSYSPLDAGAGLEITDMQIRNDVNGPAYAANRAAINATQGY